MSAIGKGHLKCKHPKCSKVRPYWADHCKAHRAELKAPAPALAQVEAVAELERGGWSVSNRLHYVDGSFDVELVKYVASQGFEAFVDRAGKVNGKSLADFLSGK